MTQKDSLILIGAKDGRVKAYMVRLLNTGPWHGKFGIKVVTIWIPDIRTILIPDTQTIWIPDARNPDFLVTDIWMCLKMPKMSKLWTGLNTEPDTLIFIIFFLIYPAVVAWR